jgi:hypothetical protein
MSAETLERDDLSIYVIAGVPRSFKSKLQQFVAQGAKDKGDVVLIGQDMAEWVIAKLRDEKRPSKSRTPASQALWRAYSALSAARYHLQNHTAEEERVRELRRKVEELWRELSPMFNEEEEESAEVSEA